MVNFYKKILELNVLNKKEIIIITFLNIASIILEILGIFLLVPIAEFIFNKKFEFNYFNFDDKKLSLLIIISCLILFSLRFVSLIYIKRLVIIKSYIIEKNLREKITKNYIANYKFLLFKNIAVSKILNDIYGVVNAVCRRVYISIYMLISEIIIILFILFIINYKFFYFGLSLILFFVCISSVYFIIIKNRIQSYEDKMRFGEKRLISIVNTIFSYSGIKQMTILGKEEFLYNKFKKINFKMYKMFSNHFFFKRLPQYLIELIVIWIILIFLLFYSFNPNLYQFNIRDLTLTAVLFIKLVPSIKAVITHTNAIIGCKNNVEELHTILHNTNYSHTSSNKHSSKNIIFKDLNISNFSLTINKNVLIHKSSLKFKNNDKIFFIGRTGSGKSLFLDCLTGLRDDYSGAIYFNGHDIREFEKEWQKNIFYLPQNNFLINGSLFENIALKEKNQISKDDEIKMQNIIDKLELNYIFNKNQYIQENGVNLSGGDKQKIGIARAIYNKKNLLILDEATSALDKKTEERLINILLEEYNEKCVCFVSHNNQTHHKFNKIIQIKNNNLILSTNE